MDRQQSPDELRQLVLGVLARREACGVEIAAAIEARLPPSDGPGLAEGSVYPVLRRLERDGLLNARWVEIGEGAPRRRYYVLTPAGERQATRAADRAPRTAPSIARCSCARP
jgi:PadR family transcriptional regulator PadR